MKIHTLIPGIIFSLMLSAAASDCTEALQTFTTYEQGKPLAMLIDTRRAVFQGTTDEAVRAQHERELLAFLASNAHPQAKAIAVEWLGCLGSTACVPTLSSVGKDPALAAPVAAAIERIQGPPAPAGNQPTTPATDDRIAADLLSNKDLVAGSALRRIRTGAGTRSLAAKLLASLDQVPATRQIPLCEALAPRAEAAEILHPILIACAKSGDPETRAAAVKTLGRMLRPTDLPMVLDLLSDTASPAMSTAAEAALQRATHAGIDPALIRIAREEAHTRVAAIDSLAARHALVAIDPLWSLTSSKDPKVMAAAYKALGTLIPPDQLDNVAKKLSASQGSPPEEELGKLLWNIVRRHPDPDATAQALDAHAANAPAEIKEQLIRYADRIRPKTTSPKEPSPKAELPKTDDRAQLMPNGYDQVAYLDCGGAGPTLAKNLSARRTAGSAHAFGNAVHPLATVITGETISYEITGLDAGAEYVIGFSAWDADLSGRRQSFAVNETVLLDQFTPLAYHSENPTCTRIHLPLPAALTASGKITVQMRSLAGPDAVISELWLLRRDAGATNRKRVLIVTGDDFKGHPWRETGPEFAAILRADPNIEVTISESPYLLGSPVLSTYDAVFLHFKNYNDRLPTGEPLWKNLESYVHGGGGLVIAHFGCGAMQEWNGLVKIAGRVWDSKKRGHDPYGEFLVRILQTGHPATRNLTDFITHDELYTCLAGDAEIQILADATSKADQKDYPMAFVLTPGKGRVFQSPLGHDLGSLKAPGARQLYLQATRWAAGLNQAE